MASSHGTMPSGLKRPYLSQSTEKDSSNEAICSESPTEPSQKKPKRMLRSDDAEMAPNMDFGGYDWLMLPLDNLWEDDGATFDQGYRGIDPTLGGRDLLEAITNHNYSQMQWDGNHDRHAGLKEPKTIFDLPNEILNQIFDEVYPQTMYWTFGNEEAVLMPSGLQLALVSKQFRDDIVLPRLGQKAVLTASVENARLLLKSDAKLGLLATTRELRLTASTPATGSHVRKFDFSLNAVDKWAGPGILTPLMPALKTYCLQVNFGSVRLMKLEIGALLQLVRHHPQGADPTEAPKYDTRVSFVHYNDTPNMVRGLNGGARHCRTADYRLQRIWTVVFPAESRNIVEIERELHMEKCNKGTDCYEAAPQGPIPTLLCGYCFGSAAQVANPATRVVCEDCGLAAYCCVGHRESDSLRHRENECVFRPWSADNDFAGRTWGNSGYICRKMTTTWDTRTQIVERVWGQLRAREV